MKTETYQQKRDMAASDLSPLTNALEDLEEMGLTTHEGRNALEALRKAVKSLEAEVDRYERFIAVAAKAAPASAADTAGATFAVGDRVRHYSGHVGTIAFVPNKPDALLAIQQDNLDYVTAIAPVCLQHYYDQPQPVTSDDDSDNRTVCHEPNCWEHATRQIAGYWYCAEHGQPAPVPAAPVRAVRLTDTQHAMLKFLAGRNDPTIFGDIRRELKLTQNGGSKSVESLLARNLIAPAGRWLSEYVITDAGRAALAGR